MLIAPEEYRQFADLVKRIVLLEVLERVLELDRRAIGQTPVKMRRVIGRMLEETRDRVVRDALRARRELRRIGGEIVEVRQLADAREVKARFRGFFHTQCFVNEWLRSECEELFRSYWSGEEHSSPSAVLSR